MNNTVKVVVNLVNKDGSGRTNYIVEYPLPSMEDIQHYVKRKTTVYKRMTENKDIYYVSVVKEPIQNRWAVFIIGDYSEIKRPKRGDFLVAGSPEYIERWLERQGYIPVKINHKTLVELHGLTAYNPHEELFIKLPNPNWFEPDTSFMILPVYNDSIHGENPTYDKEGKKLLPPGYKTDEQKLRERLNRQMYELQQFFGFFRSLPCGDDPTSRAYYDKIESQVFDNLRAFLDADNFGHLPHQVPENADEIYKEQRQRIQNAKPAIERNGRINNIVNMLETYLQQADKDSSKSVQLLEEIHNEFSRIQRDKEN